MNASGGGDGPEDVAGGFENALKQDWPSKSKYAIFITDAPCHGDKYHEPGGDDYPQGDPKGRKVEDQMQQFAEKGIHFSAVVISESYTKKMFDILDQSYKKKMG